MDPQTLFSHLSQFSRAFLEIFSLLKPGYCRALAQPPLLWVCLPTSCSLDDLPKRGPARGAGGGGRAHTLGMLLTAGGHKQPRFSIIPQKAVEPPAGCSRHGKWVSPVNNVVRTPRTRECCLDGEYMLKHSKV